MTNRGSVVLLNSDYSFLNTISWKKAMCLMAKGKTEVVKYSDRVIKGVGGLLIKVPYVMRLIKFIRTLYKSKVPFSKKNVMIRDGMACVYCGAENIRLTIDHILPKSKGGKSTFENTAAACKPCNHKKGNLTCGQAKMWPKCKLYAPTINEFLILRMKKFGIDKIIRECF